MPTSLPTLRTRRLTLRPMTTADTDGVYRMIAASRDSFARWFGWAYGSTRESVREYIQQTEEAMTMGSAWHYVVLTKQGSLVARVGLTQIDPVHLSAELGYMLRTDFEGRGLMAEAAQTLLAHAFGAGGLHRIYAYADVENVASQKVLKRLGFQPEGTVRHMLRSPERGWRDHYAYGLLEGELRAD
jgi:ribosomal-protein-alanine N-acetyltransferase